ncbi:Ctr copper transporter [Parasponia andersonii]|uniref:Copper transport protein n=1 Tax=Parasponia andersonii TaxID=3476 RepID=A0A2P5A9U1_PARAD|nr:Ctr copper transporter [Parasponia andersonii]
MKTNVTFFWGITTEEQSVGPYILALNYVFSLCMVIEWLSHARLVKSSSNDNVKAGLLQTLMYGFRVGLAYLVMISVMSFNIGIILAAIAGYSVGFLVFDRRIFRGSKNVHNHMNGPADLPPLSCR